MPLLIQPTTHPTIPALAASIISACAGRHYIEFRYTPQKTYKDTPSRVAAREDTIFRGPLDEAKGFLWSEADCWFATSTGHWCLRLYTMNRQVKGTTGYYSERHNRRTGKNFERKNYLPRTYRIVGIRPETVYCGAGRRGKIRLCDPSLAIRLEIPNAVNADGVMV